MKKKISKVSPEITRLVRKELRETLSLLDKELKAETWQQALADLMLHISLDQAKELRTKLVTDRASVIEMMYVALEKRGDIKY